MQSMQWILGSVLFLVFVISAIGNAVIAIVGTMQRMKVPSMVPLVGGICGFVSLLIVPIQDVRKYCWLPLILDLGAVPNVATVLWHMYRSRGSE